MRRLTAQAVEYHVRDAMIRAQGDLGKINWSILAAALDASLQPERKITQMTFDEWWDKHKPSWDITDKDAYAHERESCREAWSAAYGEALDHFKAAVKVCMEQRGNIAFLSEYLPEGVFHKDTLKELANVAKTT